VQVCAWQTFVLVVGQQADHTPTRPVKLTRKHCEEG
jgi:hypothetical protein